VEYKNIKQAIFLSRPNRFIANIEIDNKEEKCMINNIRNIKPECKYKNSRFDFFVETDKEKIFIEVKGVTLRDENDSTVALFPDAPTERGVKHLYELCECKKEGYGAIVIFVIKMKGIKSFYPNKKTHPEFSEALENAKRSGVRIMCLCCNVEKDSLSITKAI